MIWSRVLEGDIEIGERVDVHLSTEGGDLRETVSLEGGDSDPSERLPEAGRFDHARYEVRLQAFEARPDVEQRVREFESTVVVRVDRERSDELVFTDADSGALRGRTINRTNEESTVPWWGHDRTGFYLVIDLTYDHDQTLTRSGLSPKEVERRRGRFDRTTPGVCPAWSLTPPNGVDSACLDVDNGLLYASYESQEQDERIVVAVDAETGEHRWQSSNVSGRSLVLGSDRVYVSDFDGRVSALSAIDGEPLWQVQVAGQPDVTLTTCSRRGATESNPGSSERLLIRHQNTITALRPTDGEETWRFSAEDSIETIRPVSSATPGGETERTGERAGRQMVLVLTGGLGQTALLAIQDSPNELAGQCSWQFERPERLIHLQTDGQHVFVTSADGCLYQLDIDTGDRIHTYDFDTTIDTAPVVLEDVLYVGCRDGRVYAFDTDTRERLWTTTVGGAGLSLAAHGGRLYAGDRETAVALDPASGTQLAEHEVADFSDHVFASCLYSSGDGATVATELSDGQLIWRYAAGGRLVRTFDGCVYTLATSDGVRGDRGVYALRATSSRYQSLSGVTESIDAHRVRLGLDKGDENGATDGETLSIPLNCLPSYGRFLDAHYRVVMAMDTAHDGAVGERGHASRQISTFGTTVTERADGMTTLSLNPVDENEDEMADDGQLTLRTERLPEVLSTESDTGYVSVYLELDEAATPDDAKPSEYY